MKRKHHESALKSQLKLLPVVLAIVILLSLAKQCFGQQDAYPFALTYDKTQDIVFTQELANSTTFPVYNSRAKGTIKKGDTLVIGKPSTNTNNFSHVILSRYSMGNAMLTGPPTYLKGDFQGRKVVVDDIFVYHSKMSRKSPVNVWVYLKELNGPAVGSNRTIMDLESALEKLEIINPHAPLSRDQAIAKLKESKDLLDLGIITQPKYDSIKSILAPIITQN